MSGQLSISGLLTGTKVGTVPIGPYTISPDPTNHYEAFTITLANGNNTIAIPTWAEGFIIVPDPANVIVMTYKGGTSDLGTQLALNSPTLINLTPNTVASFVLTSSGAGATVTTIQFF
jgi:hypothetical protein